MLKSQNLSKEASNQMDMNDYELGGRRGQNAIDCGLANAAWYQSDVPRKAMKEFMKRDDGPADRDTLILFSVMAASLVGIFATYPSWWSIPFFLVYGVLYGSAMDSRWHECGHGTAFKTFWKNDALYQIASFMMLRNPVRWKWSHARHHTDTIIVGRDPEIVATRPPSYWNLFVGFTGVADTFNGLKTMLKNAVGEIDPSEKTYIPESEYEKLIFIARVWVLIYMITVGLAVLYQSWLPILLIGTPRIYGAWHHVLTGLIQHAGLDEDVIDHRLNSRTCYMNPVSRFIYWNMNYHCEHHMFPMVPYHQLPKLHEFLKPDLPKPYRNMWSAYKDIYNSLSIQRTTDPSYALTPDMPETAKPFKTI
jgi:fatty acid desaturase